MRRQLVLSTLLATAVLVASPIAASASSGDWQPRTPLAHTHAHNDYLHERPLLDALSRRFSSIEVDIWLTDDGQLLVGHDKETLQEGNTLETLYLDPLKALVDSHANNRVYAGSKESLQLLVDVKSTSTATYVALDKLLRDRYASLLTHWTPEETDEGAVTIVISGQRDRALMLSQTDRYAAYDGRIADIGDGTPTSFMPLISQSWATVVPNWKGVGPMPAADRERLRAVVARAHAEGRTVRFWATPDTSAKERSAIWTEELAAGVDWLNTDALRALEKFLTRL